MVLTTEIIKTKADMKSKRLIKRIALVVVGLLSVIPLQAQHVTTFGFANTTAKASEQVLRKMENNAKLLFEELNRKSDQNGSSLELSDSIVSDFAKNRINGYWNYSHFYCPRTFVPGTACDMVTIDGYQVRDIPVYFKRGEGNLEWIVMTFDKTGKIIDFCLGLSKHDRTIFENGIKVSDTRHSEMIVRFISDFFTAYNTKNIDLIEKMYSEDALIITGRVWNYKNGKNSDLSRTLVKKDKEEKIVLTIQSKKDYIKKLRNIFSNNEYINIRYDEVEVLQSQRNDSIYGVRLNQYWHVSHKANVQGYYDEGKLFLIIDFRNESQPEIWVRTWQPFDVEEFFGMSDFPF